MPDINISSVTTDVSRTKIICLVLYFCTMLSISAIYTLEYSPGEPGTSKSRIMTSSGCMGNQF